MRGNQPLILETKQYANGEIKQLAVHDVLELKVAIYGALALFLGKTLWNWWNKKEDKQEGQVQMLVEAYHRDQERWENVEKILKEIKDEMVPKHVITSMIRDEIDWTHRVKKQT